MWSLNILKLERGPHLPDSANQLCCMLIEDLPVDQYDLVIGESLNPDFRSPTVAQWGLGLTGRTRPAFDIATGFITLGFLCSYIFHPGSALNKVLYIASHPVKNIDQSPFEGAGAVVEFTKSGGSFLIIDSKIIETEFKGYLEGEAQIYEGLNLRINSVVAKQLSESILELVSKSDIQFDNIIFPGFIENSEPVMPNPVDLLFALGQNAPRRTALVELSIDGNLGVTVVERLV